MKALRRIHRRRKWWWANQDCGGNTPPRVTLLTSRFSLSLYSKGNLAFGFRRSRNLIGLDVGRFSLISLRREGG